MAQLNTARPVLLGEWYAGAAQGETDVVMFTLGTGIGGVAMIGGCLLRGVGSLRVGAATSSERVAGI